MPTPKKVETVEELSQKLSRSAVVIATGYRGLTVSEMTELRRQLRRRGIEYQVVKNSLARLAGQKAGWPTLEQILEGPTALAFGYGEVSEPAAALNEYLRATKSALTVRGALLQNRVLSAAEVPLLAALPPRRVLVARLVGNIQGPIAALIGVLNANLAGLVGVLQARVKQMEEEATQ